jgi:NCAIR mutase (PurE)-related protein
MDEERLQSILDAVQRGDLDSNEALSQLRQLPFEDLGFARVDHHRQIRVGFPEVIFGEGKRLEHLTAITEAQLKAGSVLLVTRLSAKIAQVLIDRFSDHRLVYHDDARCLVHEPEPRVNRGRGPIAVISAGTSDIPVAEEAAVTAEVMGNEVERIYDVGVAGLHRLFADSERILGAEVLIVVAGMEGALPSVVGGLVAKPVIAVPTSIGYGASFSGLTALLAMLNSCASGVTVVNIDNGFGAGYAAALMNRSSTRRSD